ASSGPHPCARSLGPAPVGARRREDRWCARSSSEHCPPRGLSVRRKMARIAAPALLITAARLFDGSASVRPARVLVEGQRIVAVGEAARQPGGALHVDFPDATILPGLIDCHVHL